LQKKYKNKYSKSKDRTVGKKLKFADDNKTMKKLLKNQPRVRISPYCLNRGIQAFLFWEHDDEGRTYFFLVRGWKQNLWVYVYKSFEKKS